MWIEKRRLQPGGPSLFKGKEDKEEPVKNTNRMASAVGGKPGHWCPGLLAVTPCLSDPKGHKGHSPPPDMCLNTYQKNLFDVYLPLIQILALGNSINI